MTEPTTTNGYTLVDLLAAMLILSLAMVGFGQGMFGLARLQGATNRTLVASAGLRDAQAGLGRLMSDGDAGADRLTGDATSLTLDCGAANCRLTLQPDAQSTRLVVQHRSFYGAAILMATGPVRLSYVLDQGLADSWPVPDRRLVAVQILGADDRVLAYHRLWQEQPPDCAYDPVSRQCQTTL